jgi:hypothetical protein
MAWVQTEETRLRQFSAAPQNQFSRGSQSALRGSLGLARSTQSMLFGVEATDLPTLLAVMAILMVVALMA